MALEEQRQLLFPRQVSNVWICTCQVCNRSIAALAHSNVVNGPGSSHRHSAKNITYIVDRLYPHSVLVEMGMLIEGGE